MHNDLQYEWQSDDELEALLRQFCAMYNDRPHQGSGIPGLSPNMSSHGGSGCSNYDDNVQRVFAPYIYTSNRC